MFPYHGVTAFFLCNEYKGYREILKVYENVLFLIILLLTHITQPLPRLLSRDSLLPSFLQMYGRKLL